MPLTEDAWKKPGHALQTAIACATESQAKRGADGKFIAARKPREIVTEMLRHSLHGDL